MTRWKQSEHVIVLDAVNASGLETANLPVTMERFHATTSPTSLDLLRVQIWNHIPDVIVLHVEDVQCNVRIKFHIPSRISAIPCTRLGNAHRHYLNMYNTRLWP